MITITGLLRAAGKRSQHYVDGGRTSRCGQFLMHVREACVAQPQCRVCLKALEKAARHGRAGNHE